MYLWDLPDLKFSGGNWEFLKVYLTKVNILVLKKSKDKANKKVYVAQMKNVAKLHILS